MPLSPLPLWSCPGDGEAGLPLTFLNTAGSGRGGPKKGTSSLAVTETWKEKKLCLGVRNPEISFSLVGLGRLWGFPVQSSPATAPSVQGWAGGGRGDFMRMGRLRRQGNTRPEWEVSGPSQESSLFTAHSPWEAPGALTLYRGPSGPPPSACTTT